MSKKPRSTGPNGEVHAFTTNEREKLTDQERARLFLERGGRCHRCKRKILVGDIWYDEHLMALENGGTNAWENRDLTCEWCFPKKNAEDDAIAKKIRHVATNHIIPTEQKQSVWKPMPGSKRSGVKKHMDGRVTRRS